MRGSLRVSTAVPADPAPADPPRPGPAEIDVTGMFIAALLELAESGDAEAQTELGERYEHGHGVESTRRFRGPGAGERPLPGLAAGLQRP